MDFKENVLALLREKMLVSPVTVKVREGKGVKEYHANGIHLLTQGDLTNPSARKLRLFMPESATMSKNLRLLTSLPKQIATVNGDRRKFTFDLEPICFNSDSTVTNEESKNQTVASVETPMVFSIYLPLKKKNKTFKREFTYNDVIMAIARDLYEKFYTTSVEFFRSQARGKEKRDFCPSSKQIKAINSQFISFVKSFDAFEVGYQKDPIILGFRKNSEFSPRINYENYQVLLYRIPESDKKLAQDIVEERKEAIAHIIEETKSRPDSFDGEQSRIVD